MHYDSPLIQYSQNVIQTLLESPVDSKDGISIVAEQPLGCQIMLNTTRPAVLRQYYGSNKTKSEENVVQRATYGYNNGTNPVGTDPLKYITKPFDHNLTNIASALQEYCNLHQQYLNLDELNLNTPFNSCTALIYNAGKSIKKKSNLTWHCDHKYSKKVNMLNLLTVNLFR